MEGFGTVILVYFSSKLQTIPFFGCAFSFPKFLCFPNFTGPEARLSPEILRPSRKAPGRGLASKCAGEAAV